LIVFALNEAIDCNEAGETNGDVCAVCSCFCSLPMFEADIFEAGKALAAI